MKKTRIVAILIPLLIAALSVLGSERTADADSRGRGGGTSVRGSGSHSGGGTRVGGYGYSGRGGGYSRGYSRYASPGRSHSHGGHWSGSTWIGPGFGFYDPFYYPYYPYPSYRYYAPPTVVVPQEPQEYILPESQQEETGYWYYCKNPQGYYPYVERCPSGWMRVVPDASPPDSGQ